MADDADHQHELEALAAILLAWERPVPSHAQITAFAGYLAIRTTTAYRAQIITEVEKLSLTADGALDPFLAALLTSDATTTALGMAQTFRKWSTSAEGRGEDMEAWQQKWAKDRSIAVDAYEEGRAQSRAQKAYYQNNPHITGTVSVEPGDGVCDICIGLIDLGTVALGSAEADDILSGVPAHLWCDHEPSIDTTSDTPDASSVWAAGLDVSE